MLVMGYVYSLNIQKSVIKQENQYLAILNEMYPRPPEVITNISGTIKGVYGTILMVEINDPEDYIPHADGTQQKKMNVSVNVTNDTKITLVRMDMGGEPKKVALDAVKVGRVVGVWSNENIRTSQKVDATLVQIIQ